MDKPAVQSRSSVASRWEIASRILESPGCVAAVLALVFLTIYGMTYSDLFFGGWIFTHDAIIWYGIFHYYVVNLAHGVFPYWDPYLMTGTYFYPNLSLIGLLDPTVLLYAAVMRFFDVNPLSLFVWFHVSRLLIFTGGAFLLFKHVSKNAVGAVLAAGALLFALAPCYSRTNGAMLPIYLAPLAFYFLLRFLEGGTSTKRTAYLFAFTLATGIMLNIYIPAYYLFNLASFFVVIVVLRIAPLSEIKCILRDRSLRTSLMLSVALLAMMAAPPLMLMVNDVSPRGELFPMVRILQKNDGVFKKMMASDLAASAFSNKFHDDRAIFSTYGNMVSMLYPDLLKSFHYWVNHDGMSEIDQYVGIIPFLAGIIGLIYSTSRFRLAAVCMLVLAFINMFSFSGFYSRPYNWIQKAFNFLFPPLNMIEVRELFGSYFLLYFAMLASLGFALLLDPDRLSKLERNWYHRVSLLCSTIIALKIFLTGFLEQRVIVTSLHDLFVIAQIVLFAGVVYYYAKGMLSRRVAYLTVVLVILVDFAAYSAYFTDRTYERTVLQEGSWLYEMTDTARTEAGTQDFLYFREALVAPPGIAFADSIVKRKGAFTYGNNHAIFSTKRFYDYYTHVPLQNQFVISGIVNPIIGFFPQDAVTQVRDKQEALKYIVRGRESDLWGKIFVELNSGNALQPGGAEQMGDLRQYEDVPALKPENMVRFVSEYYAQHEQDIRAIRNNIDLMLQTSESAAAVRGFSPNDLTVEVENRADGYLVFLDGWSRYWHAYDNGTEVPVLVANYNFKAVQLPRGRHVVKFVFNPVHYKIGLALFYLGLVITAGLIARSLFHTDPGFRTT